ncbi:MAG: biotin/lipoyl-binding protein [Terracidiphilus sp.]|nr:biotin/lipoyl-binding protein [Terracidiphilus sp.]
MERFRINAATACTYISVGTVALAVLLALVVLWQMNGNPRTDDASVRANYVQFAPEVSGRLISLNVKDNFFVRQGTVLFKIDPRPYEYALQQALSNQQLLEKQIEDEQRKIAAQSSGVQAEKAGLAVSQTQTHTVASNAQATSAAVERTHAAVNAAEAQMKLAHNELTRIEPLLQKQYVTVEQVDEARTRARIADHVYAEAQASLQESIARERQAQFQQQESRAAVMSAEARLQQSMHTVDTLDILISQRADRAARVDAAKLDLERCTVIAPFDGYVTNLNISEGEYAKPGAPIFTLIDQRNWYVVANYRESELKAIWPGKHVDVYLMSNPSRRFDGVVESIGYGISPDDSNLNNGLPQIEHTLNWVHLAARFPIRIRVQNPDRHTFRVGETAVSIVR